MSDRGKVAPAELDQLALDHNFGAGFRGSRSVRPPTAMRFIWLLLFIGVGLLAIAVNAAVLDQQEHGAWYYASGLLAVCSLPWIFAFYLWRKLKQIPTEWIALYERGVVYVRGQEDPVALAWAEVDALMRIDVRVIVNGKYDHTEHHAGINGRNGSTIPVGDAFPDAEELIEKITERTADVMLPRMVASLKADKPVDFHKFRIHPEWIEFEGKRLTWNEVAQIHIREGAMRITKRGEERLWNEPWAAIETAYIPNLSVFITLVNAVRMKRLDFVRGPSFDPI